MRERVNPAEAFAKGGDSFLSNLEVSCVVPVSTYIIPNPAEKSNR
jgi:hypothetical protein